MKLLPKFVSFFLSLTIVVVGTALVVSRRQVHAILVDEVEHHGLMLAKNAGASMAEAVASNNEAATLAELQKLKDVSNAAYAMALDNAGLVIAHTNVAASARVNNDAMTLEAIKADHPLVRESSWEGRPVVDVALPIHENVENDEFLLGAGEAAATRRVGTVRLSIPISETLRVRDRIFLWQVILLTSGIGLTAALLMAFLFRTVLRPTRRLIEGLGRVSQGEFGQELQVASHDELGQLTRVFNQMNDVLGRTTVSKDYMDAVLAQMSDPLFVIRPNGTIGSVNMATTALFGYSETELVGRPVYQIFPPSQNPFTAAQLLRRLAGDRLPDMELAVDTKEKGVVTVLLSSSILRAKDGAPEGIICMAKDITERKKLEARMLQSDKLSAVGQLAAGVAHEINNPLGIILGFAQSIRSQLKMDDSTAVGFEFIEKEALRCKALVQNLLVFSRASKSEQRENVDFNGAVEEALSLVTAQSRVKNIELVRDLEADLPRLAANRNQIQQIVINLCNNAMDAMNDKGELTIKTRKVIRNGTEWVVLSVTDTGTGIAKEHLDKIFEPFFTTKEVGKGTGLGLSLIHEIVQKHHGTVEVASELGKGTTFTVFLPTHLSSDRAA